MNENNPEYSKHTAERRKRQSDLIKKEKEYTFTYVNCDWEELETTMTGIDAVVDPEKVNPEDREMITMPVAPADEDQETCWPIVHPELGARMMTIFWVAPVGGLHATD